MIIHFYFICDNKDLVFALVSGHVGIRGNSVVELAAKRALEKPVKKRRIVHLLFFLAYLWP